MLCSVLVNIDLQKKVIIFANYFKILYSQRPLNECVFYVQIQAAKQVYSDSSLDKLW